MCFTSNVLTVDALLRTVRKVNLWCHVQAVLYKNVVVGKVYISKELILLKKTKAEINTIRASTISKGQDQKASWPIVFYLI